MLPQGVAPGFVARRGQVQPVVLEKLPARSPVHTEQGRGRIYRAGVGQLFNAVPNQPIGLADRVGQVPARRADFDRQESQGYIRQMQPHFLSEGVKEQKDFFRVSPVSEVIVARVKHHRTRLGGQEQPVNVPRTGRQRRTAEAQIKRVEFGKVPRQRIPEPDGGTAIKHHPICVGG